MKAIIISAVGTSLLTNFARAYNISTSKIFTEPSSEEEFLKFIKEKGLESCAEVSSICKILDILEKDGIRKSEVGVFLISSDTREGKFCTIIIEKYFKLKGISVKKETAKGLIYDSKEFINKGLLTLVEIVSREVEYAKEMGCRVIINITPGFKPEIAYMTLIGILSSSEIYYIHERFREPIKIPPLPIKIDEETLKEYSEVLDYLREEKPLEEVERVFKERLEKVKPLTVIKEKNGKKTIQLGPAGKTLHLMSQLEKKSINEITRQKRMIENNNS